MSDETSLRNIEVGRRLAEARIKAGLNQSELGKAIGVSGPRISHFESGQSFPKDEYRTSLAEAVHVSEKELFDPPYTNRSQPRAKGPQSAKRPPPANPKRPQPRAQSDRDIATPAIKLLHNMDHTTQNLALAMLRTLSRITR